MSNAQRLFKSIVLLGVAAGSAVAVACSSNANEPHTPNCHDDGYCAEAGRVDSGDDGYDATPADAGPPLGKSLCPPVSDGGCVPDDDDEHQTPNALHCTEPPDAGSTDGGDAGVASACRVGRDGGAAVTQCTDSLPTGGDGATCDTGNDCAPGFDCVVGTAGARTCRHYCCGGTCTGHLTQSLGPTFCDVQPLADVNQKAPVCMPLQPCTLLGAGTCSVSTSCAIVTDAGDTGCVEVGPQPAGASCDEDHCAAGLTCIGQPGARACYQLCKVGESTCGPSRVCATSMLFKDPSIGLCRTP